MSKRRGLGAQGLASTQWQWSQRKCKRLQGYHPQLEKLRRIAVMTIQLTSKGAISARAPTSQTSILDRTPRAGCSLERVITAPSLPRWKWWWIRRVGQIKHRADLGPDRARLNDIKWKTSDGMKWPCWRHVGGKRIARYHEAVYSQRILPAYIYQFMIVVATQALVMIGQTK